LSGIAIREDDLTGEAVRSLVAYHQAAARANSPPGHSFALDVSGLQTPDITVWTAWRGDEIAGVGALKAHPGGVGEIKSMRTHPDHLRTGVGAAILDHIVSEARTRGYVRVSLETGSGEAYAAARTLYRSRGFVDGEAFGDYVASAFNQFLHLQL
jgi:putative acetyltransferase